GDGCPRQNQLLIFVGEHLWWEARNSPPEWLLIGHFLPFTTSQNPPKSAAMDATERRIVIGDDRLATGTNHRAAGHISALFLLAGAHGPIPLRPRKPRIHEDVLIAEQNMCCESATLPVRGAADLGDGIRSSGARAWAGFGAG